MSTTDRPNQRGQTLPLFALAIVVLLGIAALAFDAGQMLLDRRTEQNAADAAALAGARYVTTDAGRAVNEAVRIASQNGFTSGVTVKVPPGPESAFAGRAGYIEVLIEQTRPSLFASVLRIFDQRTGVLATAANRVGAAANFSMLALNPTQCQAANFGGSGTVTVGGNIQVDSSSTCGQGAFNAGGSSTVTVSAPNGSINVVGSAKCGGSSSCSPTPTTGAPFVPDPLASLPAPALPGSPNPVQALVAGGRSVPDNCPGGSNVVDAANPATCTFTSSYAGTTWLLSPGYYPGGIKVLGGTVLLLPGVYYLGGGGLEAAGTGANLYSVGSGWSTSSPPTSCTPTSFAACGGVLIYNTNDPDATSGGSVVKDMQPVSLNGAASVIHLYPIQNAGPYTNIVFFKDRNLPPTTSGDLQLNGNGSNLYVQGTIYAPNGYVAVEGSGNLGPSQIIADTFKVTGSGNLSVGYNEDLVAQLVAVGLVE